MLSPWCLVTTVVAADVEGRAEAAEKVVAELEKAKTAGEKHKTRVVVVQVELKDAVMKCEALEQKQKEQSSKQS